MSGKITWLKKTDNRRVWFASEGTFGNKQLKCPGDEGKTERSVQAQLRSFVLFFERKTTAEIVWSAAVG